MEDQAIKDELKQMDERLTEMEEKMTSIDTKLTQVVDAILGNPLTKTGGFVDNLRAMEKRVESVERKQELFEEFKKKLIWTISIIVVIGSLIQYFLRMYTFVKQQ